MTIQQAIKRPHYARGNNPKTYLQITQEGGEEQF